MERDLGRGADAVRRFREAIALDHEAGRGSDEVDDRLALAYALIYDSRRFEEARGLFPPIETLVEGYPDGRARAPYILGLIEYETGNLRAALRLFRESTAVSARLGLSDQRLDALALLADTLAILGRSAEAAACLREAEEAQPRDAPPCRQAELLNNIGWTALRAPLVGLPDPVEPLQRSVALYRSACTAPPSRANALTNLALAEIERAARPSRAALVEARAADPQAGPRIQVVWRSIEARLALAEGRTEAALQLYDEVAALGDRALLPEARLDGALGRAGALDALGRSGAARDAYEDASRQLDAWSRLVPIGEGATRSSRGTSAARAIASTFSRARRPRSRPPRPLAGAARAGSPPSPGWIGRGARAGSSRRVGRGLVEYRRARAALDARAAADAWLPTDRQAAAIEARRAELAGLQAALDGALAELGPALPCGRSRRARGARRGRAAPRLSPAPRRVGVLRRDLRRRRRPSPRVDRSTRRAGRARGALAGPGRRRDRERAARARRGLRRARSRRRPRAALGGRPLIERLPVAYGLDLPPVALASAITGAPLALIVADPLEDLPAARGEAGEVAAALEQAGWRVNRIEGRAATHAAVAAALEAPGVALLHYAGHATVEGRDGWETGLPLASGGRLTVGDVIALARVPERIILSGCDTARAQETARTEGLGLAQAFAVAGARAVVASTRPVQDQLARSLMAALYRSLLASPGALDLAAALRDAQRAIAAAPVAGDWASFRAIVR